MNARPLMTELRGNLLLDEPMSKHTSWRIGGPADRYYQPADIVDLSLFLSQLPENEPVYWLGLGSNLLVRDGGIRGTVIATSGVVDGLEQLMKKQCAPRLAWPAPKWPVFARAQVFRVRSFWPVFPAPWARAGMMQEPSAVKPGRYNRC